MEPNHRYYERRALEEMKAAARAVTPEGKARHLQLAEDFRKRSQLYAETAPSWPYRGIAIAPVEIAAK
jgi:hypothetical protein